MTIFYRSQLEKVTEDGGYTDLVVFTANEKPTPDELHEELTTRCTHTYDCCGHRYYRACCSTLKQLSTYTYSIKVASYLNI